MTREIQLTRGKVALVDDDDFERVNQFKWYSKPGEKGETWYARRTTTRLSPPRRNVFLHRFILQPPPGKEIDHINGNGLDCRKSNLRICTSAGNKRNRTRHKNNLSGYKGVSRICGTPGPRNGKQFTAWITVDYKRVYLGSFYTAIEAALAYDAAAREHHGEFARTNF